MNTAAAQFRQGDALGLSTVQVNQTASSAIAAGTV
jgi:hypothetical protein